MTDDLFARVRDTQDASLEDPSVREQVEARIVAHARKPAAAPRSSSGPWLLACAASLVIGVAGAWALTRAPAPRPALAYEVRGGVASTGGFVAALTPVEVRFSDESLVSARPGAHVRVVGTTPDGATVAIEQGGIDAHIEHDRETDWRFLAGPFAIVVTGTRFSAEWSPGAGALSVSVTEGAVRVEGACLDAPRPVRASESVVLSCDDWIAPVEAMAGPVTPIEADDAGDVAVHHVPIDRHPPATVVAVADAPPEVVASESPASPPADDARIAEATRAALAGDVDGAERTLRSVRDTRPGTTDASLAAFLLGRLAFDEQHDYEGAARWFATYVLERSDGPLVREALGRELEARLRAGDTIGARDVATRYLARFPDGPHARRAQTLLASPAE